MRPTTNSFHTKPTAAKKFRPRSGELIRLRTHQPDRSEVAASIGPALGFGRCGVPPSTPCAQGKSLRPCHLFTASPFGVSCRSCSKQQQRQGRR